MLKVSNLNVSIGPIPIIRDASLVMNEGEMCGLIGRNGAGKTTCLRTIMGLWKASAGRIEFDGSDIARRSTPAVAQLGIGYVPESMGIFAGLAVRENLALAARSGPLDAQRLEWIFGFFPALKKFWNLPAGHLSGGQKQMLAIARAIIEPRKLLLIDEPTKGLAPAIIAHMVEAFRELKRTDTTILLVEQNFNFARQLGDRVAVMDDGRIVHTGAMAELADDEGLQQRLLSLSLAAHQ